MNTIYDVLAVATFVSIVALFVQRATSDRDDPRPMWSYLLPAIGCAVLNQLGNRGYDLAAVMLLGATAAYIVLVLRPFAPFRQP